MTVWALADLHLAFGNPHKNMEVFGKTWKDYPQKIQTSWKKHVKEDDLVLIPGDISWAVKLEEALIDLHWINLLPGEKLLLKGNHDSWWPSASKLQKALPERMHFIQNNAYHWKDYTFGGARLWDTREYNFFDIIEFVPNPFQKKVTEEDLENSEKIFLHELSRLKLSLEKLNPKAKKRIALTHYPPIGKDLAPSRASKILEDFGIDICVFGHLHNLKKEYLNFGKARGVEYVFAAADALDFTPVKLLD